MQQINKTAQKYITLLTNLKDGTQSLQSMAQVTQIIGVAYGRRGKLTPEETALVKRGLEQALWDNESADGVGVGEDMTAQALAWLRNLHRTPTGKVRTTSPFGYREVLVLDHARGVRWVDVYHVPNRSNQILPVWRVSGVLPEGGVVSFDYYAEGRSISITG